MGQAVSMFAYTTNYEREEIPTSQRPDKTYISIADASAVSPAIASSMKLAIQKRMLPALGWTRTEVHRRDK